MGEIIHIVLVKQSPEAPEDFSNEWIKRGNAMKGRCPEKIERASSKWVLHGIGQIPGLLETKCGTCMEGTKAKAEGFSHSDEALV